MWKRPPQEEADISELVKKWANYFSGWHRTPPSHFENVHACSVALGGQQTPQKKVGLRKTCSHIMWPKNRSSEPRSITSPPRPNPTCASESHWKDDLLRLEPLPLLPHFKQSQHLQQCRCRVHFQIFNCCFQLFVTEGHSPGQTTEVTKHCSLGSKNTT